MFFDITTGSWIEDQKEPPIARSFVEQPEEGEGEGLTPEVAPKIKSKEDFFDITSGSWTDQGFIDEQRLELPKTEVPPQPAEEVSTGDYLYGSLVETPAHLAYGAMSFFPAEAARHGAVMGQKIQQKLGLVPEMTPEQQADLGNKTAEFIQTMGGLLHPVTETGEANMEIVGNVMGKVSEFAHRKVRAINKEKYPNLHNLAATGVEIAAFALFPKVAKDVPQLAKAAKLREKAGKATGAVKDKLFKKAEKAEEKSYKDLENFLSKSENTQVKEAVDVMANRVAEVEEIYKQQAVEGVERQRGIERRLKEGIPAERVKPEPLVTPERPLTTGEPSLTAMERARMLEEGRVEPEILRRPTGEEPISALETPMEPEIIPSGKVSRIMEEGIPIREYQISPETGKPEMTFTAAERRAYQIGEEGVKLVEKVPRKKSVWQIVTDPITNESGAITIPLRKVFKDKKKKPVIGYHGTQVPKFKAFDNSVIQKEEHGWSGAGHYFTTNKETAQRYAEIGEGKGRVVEVVFDIKNPIEKFSSEYKKIVQDTIGQSSITNREQGFKVTEALKKKGYDSVIVDRLESPLNEINVFDSKNIHIIEKGDKALIEGFKPEDLIIDELQDKYNLKLRFNEKGYLPVRDTVMLKRAAKKEGIAEGVIDSLLEAKEGKSVWSMVTDPLKNEKGFIKIPNVKKIFEKKISPERRELIRKAGRAAEQAGLELHDFLVQGGMNKDQARKFEKMYKFAKEEEPLRAGLETPKKSPKDFEFFKLEKGSEQWNKGKWTNQKIQIDKGDVERFFKSPEGRTGLTSFFKPSEFMFDRYPELRPLLDQSREILSAAEKDLQVMAKRLKGMEKEYSNKALRKEAGVSQHAKSESGRYAMEKQKEKIVENPEYKELAEQVTGQLKLLAMRVNSMRAKLGKKPIRIMEDYLTFFAKENFITDMKNLISGERFDARPNNLILDSAETIHARHQGAVHDSPLFAHIKRKGVEKGVKLETDPLVILSRYSREAINAEHKSPLNAFVAEMLKGEMIDPVSGKKAVFADINPSAARELASWNNAFAGGTNLKIPRTLERLAQKGMDNLTTAQLLGNLRTAIVQSAALGPTAWKLGYRNTMKGIVDTMRMKDNAPVKESTTLPTAAWDIAAENMHNAIGGTKWQKGVHATRETAAFLMKSIDYFAREATFRTAWRVLEPKIKAGELTKKEAIRIADSEVIRTQGSGLKSEVSPIQRNVLGKMITLWQTHVITQANFFAKDIMGLNNPKLSGKEKLKRMSRAAIGVAGMGYLYEQVFGIQSPFPAPVQAMKRGIDENSSELELMHTFLLEMSESLPFGGSVKFGSNPFGAMVEHAGDIVSVLASRQGYDKNLLFNAIGVEGKKKDKAQIRLLELMGKTLGVPFTAQAAKYVRGRMRGESVPRALIGNLGQVKKTTKRRKSSRRRSTRQRRR